jgi:hypothetical protein
MRKPFIVTGYKVTENNMDAIARWCEGHVIRDTERPFIRVPVIRPSNPRQTEAYVGTSVLLSNTPRGDKSFKVYTQEWLDKNFFVIPDEIEDDDENTQDLSEARKKLAEKNDNDEVSDDDDTEPPRDNVRTLPRSMNTPFISQLPL